MRRVTFVYEDGTAAIYRAGSASWGDASRNVVLREVTLMEITGVERPAGTYPRQLDFALVPLAGVRSMTEEAW